MARRKSESVGFGEHVSLQSHAVMQTKRDREGAGIQGGRNGYVLGYSRLVEISLCKSYILQSGRVSL